MGKLGDKRKLTAVPPPPIHAYVCTPAYDGKVETGFSQALAEAAFCAPLHGVRITAGIMGNGAFIDLARNIFVKRFMEDFTDCTHLFFIDADLKFTPNAFIGLLKSNLPICAGIYRRRQEPEEYPFRGVENPDGGGLWFIDDWLQCNRVPTGFLCIRRDVVTAAVEAAPKIKVAGNDGYVPWVFHTEWESDGPGLDAVAQKYGLSPEFIKDYGHWLPTDDSRFIGEDYGFCNDYMRRNNHPISVWTNFDFTHGGYDCNMFKWLTKEVDAAAAAKEFEAPVVNYEDLAKVFDGDTDTSVAA